MITSIEVVNESRIIVVYDQKGFMYSFKTYFGVVVVENVTQEGTHCIYDTVFLCFFFPSALPLLLNVTSRFRVNSVHF